MSSLLCNDPRTTAYSACWSGSLLYVQAYGTEEAGQASALYSDIVARNKKAVWLYMPRDEGEYITVIWKRRRKLLEELVLIVKCTYPF